MVFPGVEFQTNGISYLRYACVLISSVIQWLISPTYEKFVTIRACVWSFKFNHDSPQKVWQAF